TAATSLRSPSMRRALLSDSVAAVEVPSSAPCRGSPRVAHGKLYAATSDRLAPQETTHGQLSDACYETDDAGSSAHPVHGVTRNSRGSNAPPQAGVFGSNESSSSAAVGAVPDADHHGTSHFPVVDCVST